MQQWHTLSIALSIGRQQRTSILQAGAKTSHLLVANVGGHVDRKFHSDVQRNASAQNLLDAGQQQVLAGQLLTHPICSLHQIEPGLAVLIVPKGVVVEFAAICNKNLVKILDWSQPPPPG
jgi:hypothetical protein